MLFRQAALDHLRRGHGQGHVLLRSPRSFWFMSVAALGLGLAVLLMLFLVSYTQRARVSGHLVPDRGLVNLAMLQTGVVAEVLVHEGTKVRQGQALFRLRAERPSAAGELAQGAVRSLEQQRDHWRAELQRLDAFAAAQTETLLQKRLDLEAELPRAQAEQQLLRRRLQSAQEALARFEALQGTGFASRLQVQQRQDEVLDQQARLAALERNERDIRSQLAALVPELRAQGLRDGSPRAQAERQLAALQQEIAEAQGRHEWVLTAPVDGRLTSLQAHAGQTVAAGQLLALLLPSGAALQAQLQLPSSAAAFVQPGQKVALRYAAFPYQKFGQHEGVVQEVSRAAVQPPAAGGAGGAGAAAERSYRVLVRPLSQTVMAYGQPVALQADMQVEADVMLSERRLIEWIFEPMLALKGRL
ncbi:anibiotic ABC transporter [Paucibacter aquatile]|uniref:Anibiotic ABC transporter n=1 Tax=Kinneretia aquatilis TaxID=2070761 RepID=A0A2N8L1D8_9BURK|nr:HlyD family efflux transporter periplasmic adaptor subunit [Paucibacter aquatile]PND39487.1 anibiotic ABC transporter [Paucibacter aquatile]